MCCQDAEIRDAAEAENFVDPGGGISSFGSENGREGIGSV
jgi:hypothetical protein